MHGARLLLALWGTVVGPAAGLAAPAEPQAADSRRAPQDGLVPAEQKKGGVKKKSGGTETGIPWLPLKDGLAKLRLEYSPAIAVHGAGEKLAADGDEKAPAPPAATLEAYLSDSSLKRILRGFVCIRLEASDLSLPYPRGPRDSGSLKDRAKAGAGEEEKPEGKPAPQEAPVPEQTVGERLGLREGKPSFAVLSFREEVVLRHDRDFPTRFRLSKELTRIAGVNKLLAAYARRAEKALDDSRYAFHVGKKREAILIIREFDDKKAMEKLDPVAQAKVKTLTSEYRDLAREAMKEADKLEAQRKFTEAIVAYDDVAKSFPFTDVMQQASKRKGEILRKMTYGF